MLDLNKIYIYRMTHIDNIPHIIQNGITHSNSKNANVNFIPIGDNSLIYERREIILKNNKLLGDYIPFYFGIRTPMLYVLQNGYNMVTATLAENIVYCVSSVQNIIDLQLDFVFTDGHAKDKFTTQFFSEDIQNIGSLLDWNSIKATYWKDEEDLDLKRKKQAEFLVLGDIPYNSLLGFIVYNENSKQKLINRGVDAKIIGIKPEYYF